MPSPVRTRSRVFECRLEPDGLGDRIESGNEMRADRREAAGEPAGCARAVERGDIDTGTRAIHVGELFEAPRQ